MNEILEGIIIVYMMIHIAALIIAFVLSIWEDECDVGLSFVNPLVIHQYLWVNWFGAWLLAIIAHICLPIIAILYWIYKLCTVGR